MSLIVYEMGRNLEKIQKNLKLNGQWPLATLIVV